MTKAPFWRRKKGAEFDWKRLLLQMPRGLSVSEVEHKMG